MKTICIIYLFLFTQIDNSSYYDTCGNEIIIQKPEKMPSVLTQEFLIENFSSSLLNDEICNHQYKFKVRIEQVKRISKNKYDFRISIFPKKDAGIEDVLKYRGYSHYILRTQKNDGNIKLKSFKFAFSEI